jgi:hypothetical protein
LSDHQAEMLKELRSTGFCSLTKTQIDLIYVLSGILVLALKLVFGLFCFNMWLMLDPKNNGIPYIEFKKRWQNEVAEHNQRVLEQRAKIEENKKQN